MYCCYFTQLGSLGSAGPSFCGRSEALAEGEIRCIRCICIGKMPAAYAMVVFHIVLIDFKCLQPLFPSGRISGETMHRHAPILSLAISTNNAFISRHSNNCCHTSSEKQGGSFWGRTFQRDALSLHFLRHVASQEMFHFSIAVLLA